MPGEGAEERVADGPLGAVVPADVLVVLEVLRQLLVPDQPRPPPRLRARTRHGLLPLAGAAAPLRRGSRGSHAVVGGIPGHLAWLRAAPGVRAGEAGARGGGGRGLLVANLGGERACVGLLGVAEPSRAHGFPLSHTLFSAFLSLYRREDTETGTRCPHPTRGPVGF